MTTTTTDLEGIPEGSRSVMKMTLRVPNVVPSYLMTIRIEATAQTPIYRMTIETDTLESGFGLAVVLPIDMTAEKTGMHMGCSREGAIIEILLIQTGQDPHRDAKREVVT